MEGVTRPGSGTSSAVGARLVTRRDDARTEILRSIRHNLDASLPHDRARDAAHQTQRHQRPAGIPLPLAPTAARSTGNQPPGLEMTPAARFCAQLERVGGRCAVVSDIVEASEVVGRILAELGVEKVALSDAPDARAVMRHAGDAAPKTVVDPDKTEIFGFDAGISCAQWGVAETGTLVLESSEERHRMVSLIPPIHIALLRADRICATLEGAMRQLRRDAHGLESRSITFITGPSRTADIEQMLVVGVHGPQVLAVIIIEGPNDVYTEMT